MIGDERSLLRSFSRSSKAARGFGGDVERAGRGALAASLSFRGLGRSLTFASAQFLGGAGIVFALKQVIGEASRVQEETEKTGIVFARNSKQVQAWSKTLASSFGVSGGAALEAAGRFGNMLRPLGFAPALAAKMSERLVELAADMASFNNTKPDVVLEALSSGIAGQVRPLRQFGVFLSAARIQQEALADGISRTGKNLSQAQKAQASYNIILKDTKLQQGDVARNTESLSVAQSKLTASIQNLEARLGTQLLPVITQYVNRAAEWLGQTSNQEKIQKQLTTAVRDGVGVVKALGEAFGFALKITRPLAEAVGGLKNALIGLAALNLASRISTWVTGISLLGKRSEAATGKVLTLRGALLRLAAIGTIFVAVEILLNKQKIDKSVTSFLRSHKLGFATGAEIKLPVNASIQDLEKLRSQYKSLGGAGDIFAAALDKVIAKMKAQRRALDESTAAFQANAKAVIQAVTHLPKLPVDQNDFAARLRAAGFTGSTGRKTPVVTAKQKNQFFDAAIGREQDHVQDITNLDGQLGALKTIAGKLQARLEATKDVTRRLKLEDDLLGNQRAQKAVREQLAAAFSDSLSFGLTKAEATSGLKDDVTALQRIDADLAKRIRSEQDIGKKLALEAELFNNQQKIKQNLIAQRSKAQFQGLSLGPTGDQIIPGVDNLKKQLEQLTSRLSGTSVNTSNIKKQIQQIGKVLSGAYGKVTSDVRSKIQELLAAIREPFQGKGPLTSTTSLAEAIGQSFKGLGLSRDQMKELSSRFAGFNSAGLALSSRTVGPQFGTGALAGAGAGIVIPLTVELDGQVLYKKNHKIDDKRKGRNASPRRGRR